MDSCEWIRYKERKGDLNMVLKVSIPYLQVGDFKVETPIGLSELLENAWVLPKEKDEVEQFASQFIRTVFRNSDGRLVTRYERK